MNMNKFIKGFIFSTMIGLYVIVSLISTLHVIEFFEMSNPRWLAISLAVAFEIGAAASLASIIVLEKTSKTLVWSLFILLTGMQMQGNMFYAYQHLQDYMGWIELFGLQEEEPITQKRILSFVSGAILPLIALGFIKSLVDYMKPTEVTETLTKEDDSEEDEMWSEEEMKDFRNQFSEPEFDEIEESEDWEEEEPERDFSEDFEDPSTYSSGYKEVVVEPQTVKREPTIKPVRSGLGNPVDTRPSDPGSKHYGGGAS